jgi:glycerol-3-phosphate dehydrogenase (NAD(P)+)
VTNVAVIGAGVMGTALAISFDRAGCSVTVCGTKFDAEIVNDLQKMKVHPALRRHVSSSINVIGHDDWEKPLGDAGIVVIAVASVGVRHVVKDAAPFLTGDAIIGVGSKGWDPETAEPLSKVVAEAAPGHLVVIIVGPSLAAELAAGTPTGLVCASVSMEAAEEVASAVSSETVRAFVTDDVAGVEVGAALKNVLAIGVGLCDGISEVRGTPMANTKAAVFSRGLVEMGRLAVAMGGRQETVLGLAGAGDLYVTVLGGRNGRFGRLVGTGLIPEKAFEEMGTTVEGYDNAREAVSLAERYKLDLPIVKMVHSVLYEGVAPDEAVAALAGGAVEPEQ